MSGFFFVSHKMVYLLVMTDCCFMSDILITSNMKPASAISDHGMLEDSVCLTSSKCQCDSLILMMLSPVEDDHEWP